MFTIQYQSINGGHVMQQVDVRDREILVRHVAKFERPVFAVYEQATPITKAVRGALSKLPDNALSRYAKQFRDDLT